MSDLIERQEVLKEMKKMYDDAHWWLKANAETLIKTKAEAYKTCLSEMALRVYKIPSPNQWIPCSERLPEIGGAYLITGKMKYPYENKWQYFTDVAYNFGKNIDYFWDTCNDWDEGQEIHIIAWMPLLEPWKGEEE